MNDYCTESFLFSSKKQYVWRFKLDGQDYTIEMFTSILSGKKKIIQNGQIIFYDKKSVRFIDL